MAGRTYVTKGYSTHTHIPSQRGGYDHESNKHGNWYVVETTTIERIRAPVIEQTNFNGSPTQTELRKKFVRAPNMLSEPKYMFDEPRESYEPNYGSNYENSSPRRYYGRDDLVDDFFNKAQIEASRPMKTGNFTGQNMYLSSSPNKYRSLSPNKYQPSSPNKHRPSSPNKYRPSSPIKYRTLSPDKYQPSSPNKHQTSSPNKYRPSSPIHNYTQKEAPFTRTGNFASPNKYHPSSPNLERAQHARIGNFLAPNNFWQNTGPPMTHHPLTTPTNDINKVLSFLEENVNSPRLGPKRGGGGFDDFPTRSQPIEPERRYTSLAFSEANTEPQYKISGSTIDSRTAMEKYGGAFVPKANMKS